MIGSTNSGRFFNVSHDMSGGLGESGHPSVGPDGEREVEAERTALGRAPRYRDLENRRLVAIGCRAAECHGAPSAPDPGETLAGQTVGESRPLGGLWAVRGRSTVTNGDR